MLKGKEKTCPGLPVSEGETSVLRVRAPCWLGEKLSGKEACPPGRSHGGRRLRAVKSRGWGWGPRCHVGVLAGVNLEGLPQLRAGQKSAYLTVQFGSVGLHPCGRDSTSFVEQCCLPGSEPVPKAAPHRSGLGWLWLSNHPEWLERIPLGEGCCMWMDGGRWWSNQEVQLVLSLRGP